MLVWGPEVGSADRRACCESVRAQVSIVHLCEKPSMAMYEPVTPALSEAETGGSLGLVVNHFLYK